MNTREQIHALSEKMLENLGKLVAIDSQLGTPSEGNPSEKDRQRHLRSVLKLPESLVLKRLILIITVVSPYWEKARKS